MTEKVKLTRLENGLTIASENREEMESVALGLWVKAGSRAERQNQWGLAHLLEHMAFKGTKTRSALEIAAAIENVGGDINAATGLETTGYFIRVLNRDLPLAAEILGDIITNPQFDEAELAREKQVILQEIGAAEDTPDDAVFDRFTEAAYPGQALGRPILGRPETVKAFGPADLRGFMAEHYYAGNIVVAACGKIDHNELVAQMRQSLAGLPAESADGKASGFAPARYQGGDKRQSRELEATQILLGFQSFAHEDKEFYPAQILAMILGGGMSSRLFQEIREKRGLCYSIYAFNWAFQDSGLFGIHTACDAESMKRLMPALMAELGKAAADIGAEELARARAQYAAGLIMGQENAAARAGVIARQLLLRGGLKSPAEILRAVDAVNAAQVKAVAERIFFGAAPSFAAIGRIDDLPSYEAQKAELAELAAGRKS